ncbi:hypothetical protein GEMRC1_002300 [Eukaryota sp. GEM-RC1]
MSITSSTPHDLPETPSLSSAFPMPGAPRVQTSKQISRKALPTIIMSVMSLKFSKGKAKSVSMIGLIMQCFFAIRCFKSACQYNTAFETASDTPTNNDRLTYVALYTIAIALYVYKLGSLMFPVAPADWVSPSLPTVIFTSS